MRDRTYYRMLNNAELIEAGHASSDPVAQVLADRLEDTLQPRKPAPHSDQVLERALEMQAQQLDDLQRRILGARYE